MKVIRKRTGEFIKKFALKAAIAGNGAVSIAAMYQPKEPKAIRNYLKKG